MKMRSMLAAMLMSLPPVAHAATFTYAPFDPTGSDSPESVRIVGEIKVGDLERLRALIRSDVSRFKRSTIVLASNGGDILEAMKIGDLIRSSYVSVFVNKDIGICASACFLIYVSAVERGATYPAVGVHRPYFGEEHFAGLSVKDAERKQSKLYAALREFLRSRDVPQAIQERMFALASSEIYWLTFDDLDRIGPRAHWYDELMVSRCGLDKRLERGFIEMGDRFAEAAEANEHIHRVAVCAYTLTADEGEAALRRFAFEAGREKR